MKIKITCKCGAVFESEADRLSGNYSSMQNAEIDIIERQAKRFQEGHYCVTIEKDGKILGAYNIPKKEEIHVA